MHFQYQLAFFLLFTTTSLWAQETKGKNSFETLVQTTTQVVNRLKSLPKTMGNTWKWVEKERRHCRQRERKLAGGPSRYVRDWKVRWKEVAPLRKKIATKGKKIVGPWEKDLAQTWKGPLERGDKHRLGRLALQVLTTWCRYSEPPLVIAHVQGNPIWTKVLSQTELDEDRRKLLFVVATRTWNTPHRSDVDVLVHTVEWERLFLAHLKSSNEALKVMTKDLLHLFTERDQGDGKKPSLRHYHKGRYTDRGFAAALRDGSDQVRHFSWALYSFAHGTSFAVTEKMLYLKERWDALRTKKKINQADLLLNRRARKVITTILKGEGKSSPSPPEKWGEIIRKQLETQPKPSGK